MPNWNQSGFSNGPIALGLLLAVIAALVAFVYLRRRNDTAPPQIDPSELTLRQLLERDRQSPLQNAALDDAVWLALCDVVSEPSDLQKFEPPVGVYYASRYMEWEVLTGGFPPAAVNIREWFEPAAEAYRVLGYPESADLILEVQKALPPEPPDDVGWDEWFRDNPLAVYNERAYSSPDWEILDARIEHVRRNREAFARVSR